MRLILAAMALTATACSEGDDPGTATLSERDTVAAQPVNKQVLVSPGRVIDQPGVLAPAQRAELGARLDRLQRETGVSGAVVLLDPPEGSSMELVGWAVGGQTPGRQLLIMVEPQAQKVRIESAGRLSPQQSAEIAATIRGGMQRGRLSPALAAGIDRLAIHLQGSKAA